MSAALRVRVWVTPVWDAVALDVDEGWSVSRLKTAALDRAGIAHAKPAEYLVKFRGAHVLDESLTLKHLGAPPGAPFVVLPSRRQPVR